MDDGLPASQPVCVTIPHVSAAGSVRWSNLLCRQVRCAVSKLNPADFTHTTPVSMEVLIVFLIEESSRKRAVQAPLSLELAEHSSDHVGEPVPADKLLDRWWKKYIHSKPALMLSPAAVCDERLLFRT